MKNELTEARKALKEGGDGLTLFLLALAPIALLAVAAVGVYVVMLAVIAVCAVGVPLWGLAIRRNRRSGGAA